MLSSFKNLNDKNDSLGQSIYIDKKESTNQLKVKKPRMKFLQQNNANQPEGLQEEQQNLGQDEEKDKQKEEQQSEIKIITFYYIYKFLKTGEQTDHIINQLQQASLFITIADCFLGFHTGIYEFGEIVKNRRKVYQKYIKDRLLFDLLCIGTLFIGIYAKLELFCIISVLFRYSQISEKISRINMNLQIQSKLSAYYDLLKLSFYILILIHIFGCGFYLVGDYSSQYEENNWIKQLKLEESIIAEKYIFSIYFITITMVTIGYGDIYPVNMYEKVYMIFVAFISCGLFAFSVNLIGYIATEIQKKSNDLNKKQQIIQTYLNSRQIENSSQMRVLKYLEFLNDSQEETTLEGQRILSLCSKGIKEDVLKEYYGKILNKCTFIKDHFSVECIYNMGLKMKEKSFAPGEIIIEKGKYLSELYFIISGEVEYFFNPKNNSQVFCEVIQLKPQHISKFSYQYENKVIDFRIFLSQQPSDMSIRSKGITMVAYIDYQSFVEVFQHFQNNKESFCMLRDQFLHDKRYQHPCLSCGQYKHNLDGCPQLSYQLNKTSYLQKYYEKINQPRDLSFDRLEKNPYRKKTNSLVNNQKIKLELKLIRCDLANYFYSIQFPQMNYDNTPYENYDDKQFFQVVPKIYQVWFNSNFVEEQDRVQQKTNINFNKIIDHSIQMMTSSESDSSDSSAGYSKSTNNININNINNNEKMPSIANDIALSNTAAFAIESTKNNFSSYKGEHDFKSDIQIPEEIKIPIPSYNRLSGQLLPIEEFLSPTSSKLVPLDFQNQFADQAKLEQLKNISTKNRRSLTRKDTARKLTMGQSIMNINTGSELRIQQRKSLPKQIREPSSPSKNSQLENLEFGRDSIGLGVGSSIGAGPLVGFNSNLQNTILGNSQTLNSILGLHRVSIAQGQLQDQIQVIHEMLRQQQKQTDRMLSINSRSVKSKKNVKYPSDFVNTHSRSIITTSRKKSHSNQNTHTQDLTSIKQGPNDHCYFFGKCGNEFETMKEFEFFYPKYNYTLVIRSYKRQQQFSKRVRQPSVYAQIKQSRSLKANKKKHQFPNSLKIIQ